MERPSWLNTRVRLGDLKPWEHNPRRIGLTQAERLQNSFDEFGQVEALAIGPDGEVYNGHQRLSVLLEKFGPDYEVDARQSNRALTKQERKKLTVYLHRGATGEWDIDLLKNEFEWGELIEWGFDEKELGWGNGNDAGKDVEPQIDKAEELRQKWGVELGQLWQLGEHRLICGDCTDRAMVERAMGKERATLVVTDPPYGVGYADKNKFLNAISPANRIETPIENDHESKEETQAMWKAAFSEMSAVMDAGAVVYCFMPQGGDQMMMMMMMMGAGIEPRHEIIWLKNNHVLGRVDYAYKHEPILYAWKDSGHKFYGNFQTSILEYPKPQISDLHPTQKPVALVERLISNSSLPNEIIYDPFLGSGTTLIACENLNRRCRAVEIDPGYVAVTLQRWSDLTGKTPVLSEAP